MDHRELRVKLARENVSNRELAAQISLSEQALYNKMNGVTEFKNSEIKRIAEVLHLSLDEVNAIFFDGIVN